MQTETKTYTIEEFDKAVKDYHRIVEAKNEFPDLSGLVNMMEMSMEYYRELEKTSGYKEICEYARNRRQSWLQRQMVRSKSAAYGCMALLKQPDNGGLLDKPVENKDKKMIVHLEGLEGIIK